MLLLLRPHTSAVAAQLDGIAGIALSGTAPLSTSVPLGTTASIQFSAAGVLVAENEIFAQAVIRLAGNTSALTTSGAIANSLARIALAAAGNLTVNIEEVIRLNVQTITPSGIQLTHSGPSSAGHRVVNDGHTALHVVNGGGVATVVRVQSQSPCSFGIVHDTHDLTVVVPAGSERWIGPFRRDRYNDQFGDLVITLTSLSNVTLAAVN